MSTTPRVTTNVYVPIYSLLTIAEAQGLSNSNKQFLPFAQVVLQGYGFQVKRSVKRLAKDLRADFFDRKKPIQDTKNLKKLKKLLEYVNTYFMNAFILNPSGWQLPKKLSPNLPQAYELSQKIKQKFAEEEEESSSPRVLKMFINSLTNNKQIEEAFIVAHNTCRL